MCCAGGRAVLQAIDEDSTQQNSAQVHPPSHHASIPVQSLMQLIAGKHVSGMRLRPTYLENQAGRRATMPTASLCSHQQSRQQHHDTCLCKILRSMIVSKMPCAGGRVPAGRLPAAAGQA